MNSPERVPIKSRLRAIKGEGKKKKPKLYQLGVLLIFLIFVFYWIIAGLRYEDVVTIGSDGKPTIKAERQAEIARRQKKNSEEAEQYILVAIAPGYRECYLCPGGKVWLNTGEIAKIGVSTNGIGRYPIMYYQKHMVNYVMEYRGSLTIAKIENYFALEDIPY